MPSKESMMCCGVHFCGMCSWIMLVWGLLFLAIGLGYLAFDAWALLGLGLVAMGLAGVTGFGKH